MNTYAYHIRHRNGWGTGFGPLPTRCSKCGAELPILAEGAITTGYGCGTAEPVAAHSEAPALRRGESIERSPAVCYQCCGIEDKARMIDTGRAVLYLIHAPGATLYTDSYGARRLALGRYINGALSNWPGTLKIPCRIHIGRHNIARVRYDVVFTGPDGKAWRGTQYGDNTQLCHCCRLKGGRA